MASSPKDLPDFFEDLSIDPMRSAIGGASRENEPAPKKPAVPKKKAGFYLSVPLLDRFNRKYHELKLANVPIENKSALLEAMLKHALADMDQGDESAILKTFQKR